MTKTWMLCFLFSVCLMFGYLWTDLHNDATSNFMMIFKPCWSWEEVYHDRESLSPNCDLLNDDEEDPFCSVYDEYLRRWKCHQKLQSSTTKQRNRASPIEFNKGKTMPHECSLALLKAVDTDNTILQVIEIVNI